MTPEEREVILTGVRQRVNGFTSGDPDKVQLLRRLSQAQADIRFLLEEVDRLNEWGMRELNEG